MVSVISKQGGVKAVGANWPQQKVPYTGDNEEGARSSERTRINVTLTLTLEQNYTRSVLVLMICAVSARLNRKL